MRGMDLNQFDFDYDLTWAAFFTNAEGQIYGRYGGREAGDAEAHLSLAGLKYAMQEAIAAHAKAAKVARPAAPEIPVKPFKTADEFPSARKLKGDACIHCHQVNDFRRDYARSQGDWSKDDAWMYPPPRNLGLALDKDQGDLVREVSKNSPAERAGVRSGDILETLNGLPVASFADAQYALHYAPQAGSIEITWSRDGSRRFGKLELTHGWRKSDVSWRASMWGLGPSPGVYGRDLNVRERESLGLSPTRLAFRMGEFVPKVSRQAGVRAGDTIIGINGEEMEMTMLQFNLHVRLNYNAGDRITLNVIRDGKRMDLPLVLPASDSW